MWLSSWFWSAASQLTYTSSLIKRRYFKSISLSKRHCEVDRTGVKWGKQTGEIEGMKTIIGLWRSKAINCGEIRHLEWFAGKPSERMWYGKAWREKRKGACWVLGGDSQHDLYNHMVAFSFLHSFAIKTSDLLWEMMHQHLLEAPSGLNPRHKVSRSVADCKINFRNVRNTRVCSCFFFFC